MDKTVNPKFDSKPRKVERTGEKDLVVTHDNGDQFTVKADTSERAQFLEKKGGHGKRYFSGLKFDKDGNIIES